MVLQNNPVPWYRDKAIRCYTHNVGPKRRKSYSMELLLKSTILM